MIPIRQPQIKVLHVGAIFNDAMCVCQHLSVILQIYWKIVTEYYVHTILLSSLAAVFGSTLRKHVVNINPLIRRQTYWLKDAVNVCVDGVTWRKTKAKTYFFVEYTRELGANWFDQQVRYDMEVWRSAKLLLRCVAWSAALAFTCACPCAVTTALKTAFTCQLACKVK